MAGLDVEVFLPGRRQELLKALENALHAAHQSEVEALKDAQDMAALPRLGVAMLEFLRFVDAGSCFSLNVF